MDGDDVEAEEEVLSELLAVDTFLEVPVGGGDDADIDFDGAVTADAFEFAFLEDAEEFGLDLEGDFADFVEEDSTTVSEFEASFTFGEGAGEGPFFVAEEFGFDEVFGDEGAIEFDERGFGAGALEVEGTGDEFFAGATFALDEDGGLGTSDFADELAELEHGGGLAEQFDADVMGFVVAEVLVDFKELDKVLGFTEGNFELVNGERFDEVIEGAGADATDGGLDGTEAADDDYERFLGAILEVAEEVSAFAIGEADIDDGEVEGIPAEGILGSGEGIDGEDIVATLSELLLESFTDNQVIFEYQDFFKPHDCVRNYADGRSSWRRNGVVRIGDETFRARGRGRVAVDIARSRDPTGSPS